VTLAELSVRRLRDPEHDMVTVRFEANLKAEGSCDIILLLDDCNPKVKLEFQMESFLSLDAHLEF